MKRFFVFVYNDYYPGGGMNDFVKDFDELSDAVACADKSTTGDRYTAADQAEVYDQEARETVYESRLKIED